MDIESFFTLHLGQAGQNKATGHEALSATSQIQGQSFIDLFLAQLSENLQDNQDESGDQETSSAEEPKLLQSNNPLLETKPALDIADLVAEQDVEKSVVSEEITLTETLALNQRVFDEFLIPLAGNDIETKTEEDAELTTSLQIKTLPEKASESASVPLAVFEILGLETKEPKVAEDKTQIAKNLLPQIEQLFRKIEALIEKSEGPALIAANLTPQQMTGLKLGVNNAPDKDLPIAEESVSDFPESIFNELIKILPPQAAPSHAGAVTQNVTDTAQKPAIPQTQQPTDALASALNNLVVGGDDSETIPTETPTKTDPIKSGFEQLLQKVTDKGEITAEPVKVRGIPDSTPIPKPDVITRQNLPPVPQNLLAPIEAIATLAEELGIQNNTLITSTSQFTSLVTQAQSAALPHPATQMVAVTIQKAASDGENKNFILKLDPPELGKVEVRMEFSKDKTVKAALVIEKPETYVMLQRDAQTLERALQQIGLDAESGLSFELAGQEHEFTHNGGHDSGGGNNHSEAETAEDAELIETTMNWYVDPNTGHTHYNIMA